MIDRALVELRPLRAEDVDDIMGWVNDPTIVGNIASFGGEAFTRAQELAYVEKMVASKDDHVFSIFTGPESSTPGTYLGQVGLHQIFWRSRVGRLSILIGNRAQMGKGFGSAAIAHALDHAFGPFDLHKVWLMVFATNERSLRTYERIGFVREGVLREEYFLDAIPEGGWHDMVRLSLLCSEWPSLA